LKYILNKDNDMNGEIIYNSIITCPKCGYKREETMPEDACQFFYKCKGCGAILKPKQGDCCVFCSYGTLPCPPVQEERKIKSFNK
jgi:hypothetical protein